MTKHRPHATSTSGEPPPRGLRLALALSLALAAIAAPSREACAQPPPGARGGDAGAKLQEASALSSSAIQLTMMGRLEEAREKGERAVAIMRQIGGGTGLGVMLYNLGSIYLKSSLFVPAQRTIEEAIRELSPAADAGNADAAGMRARAHEMLGGIYRETGDLQRAAEEMLIALRRLEAIHGKDSPELAGTHNVLADLLRSSGRREDAKRGYLHALKLIANHEEKRDLRGGILNNLALIADEEGDASGAEELFLRAMEDLVATRGGGSAEMVQVSQNFAMSVLAHGDPDKARKWLETTLKNARRQFGDGSPRVAMVHASLGAVALAKGEIGKALEMQRTTLEILEGDLSLRLSVGSDRQRQLAAYQTWLYATRIVSLDRDHGAGAAELALGAILRDKGRALDATEGTQRVLRERMGKDERALLDELTQVRAEIVRTTLGGTAPAEELFGKRTELERRRERLELELSARVATYAAAYRPATVADVRAALPADAALVEIVEYATWRATDRASTASKERRYAAYVLRAKGPVQAVGLGDAGVIDAAVREMRSALGSPSCANVKDAARRLHDRVMAPIRPLVGDAKRLLVSPDGALNLIPFAALVGAEGRYLLEDYETSYLSSGRDLLRYRVHSPPREAPLVIADPEFGPFPGEQPSAGRRGGGDPASCRTSDDDAGAIDFKAASAMMFDRLADTRDEAAAVQEIVEGARLLAGPSATKSAVLAVHGPSVLHIATHGVFLRGAADAFAIGSDTLNRSWLVFAGANQRGDGAGEILTGMDVSGIDLLGTRLVVLSACETGQGTIRSGEGVFGLRRALVVAGSETQVMSLWQIPSAATADLMRGYYDGLARRRGRAEAMIAAQRHMLAAPATAHPFYWAGFIVAGDPSPLDGTKLKPRLPTVDPGGGCVCDVPGRRGSDSALGLSALAAAFALANCRRRGVTRRLSACREKRPARRR